MAAKQALNIGSGSCRHLGDRDNADSGARTTAVKNAAMPTTPSAGWHRHEVSVAKIPKTPL
jgi:hypothetical protein